MSLIQPFKPMDQINAQTLRLIIKTEFTAKHMTLVGIFLNLIELLDYIFIKVLHYSSLSLKYTNSINTQGHIYIYIMITKKIQLITILLNVSHQFSFGPMNYG